jgi:hypothetical protein
MMIALAAAQVQLVSVVKCLDAAMNVFIARVNAVQCVFAMSKRARASGT